MEVQVHLLRGLTSVLPVLGFLWGLVLIDSYKLVRLRQVVFSILVGCLVAAAAFFLQTWLLEASRLEFAAFTRYVAPAVEELLKAVYILLIIRTNRVGFHVDAAIHGFAVGAGFALAENLYYLQAHPDMGLASLVVRGFGTAVMHGGSTAIFSVLCKTFVDRDAWMAVPAAWLFAVALHSAFNHLVLPPIAMTLILVGVLPPLFLAVFSRSESATGKWLGSGFDTDQELLRLLLSESAPETRVARYLGALRSRFPGEILADMLCYLRLHSELSIRAKGILMMQQAGFEVKPDPVVAAKLEEMAYLRKSIGATGLLAIAPFLQKGSRDRWQMKLLR